MITRRMTAAALFVCMLLLAIVGCAAENAGAASPAEPESTAAASLGKQEMIERHLAAMGAENVQYEGQHSYGALRGLGGDNDIVEVYRDPETNAQYLFRPDSGVLRAVFGNVADEAYERCANMADPDKDHLQQIAEAYAGKLIAPFAEGELRLDSADFDTTGLISNWAGYAGALPTGTRVYVSVLNDGTLENAVVKRGTALEHLDPASLIGETAAQEAAAEVMQQTPPAEGWRVDRTACVLEALESRIFYKVTFFGGTDRYEEDQYVNVDAVTGKILEKTWGY